MIIILIFHKRFIGNDNVLILNVNFCIMILLVLDSLDSKNRILSCAFEIDSYLLPSKFDTISNEKPR